MHPEASEDMQICRTVATRAPVSEVFAYLADFTSTTEWDPGTVTTTLVGGDGTVGSTYENVSRFLGRETRLTYVVEAYVADSLIILRGENDTVIARDTMTFEPTHDGGTQVTYLADFTFKGLARVAAPFLAPAFKRLGDEAERGLHQALDQLAA